MSRSPRTSRRRPEPSPLIDAVGRRSAEDFVRALAAGHHVDTRDNDGRTALHLAAADGSVAIVRAALAAGADPNAVDRRGWTPLHFAAQNYFPEVARLLIAGHADPDLGDENGNTPLSNAVFESRGRAEMIVLLLKAGASPNKNNKHGVSPRSMAASIANFEVPFPTDS